jgi:hypothetical protein
MDFVCHTLRIGMKSHIVAAWVTSQSEDGPSAFLRSVGTPLNSRLPLLIGCSMLLKTNLKLQCRSTYVRAFTYSQPYTDVASRLFVVTQLCKAREFVNGFSSCTISVKTSK